MTASPRNFIDRIFFGYQNAATLKAALELDVFTAIGKGVLNADALAAKCNASPRGIAALCDSLAVMGFLTKSGTGYALAEDAAVFLDRASPACIAGVHEFLAAPEFIELVFRDPAGAVRRGGSEGLANVAPDNPIWIRFARAMAPSWPPMRRWWRNRPAIRHRRRCWMSRQVTVSMASLSADAFRSAT